jgi:hypothetical protein
MSRRLLALPLALAGMLLAAPSALAVGPSAIGTDNNGVSYVGYPTTGGIQRFAPADGSSTAQPAWGTPGSGPGQLGGIVGIGVGAESNGRVWVLDTNRRVQEFSKDGAFIRGVQLPACSSGLSPDATQYGGIDVRADNTSDTAVAIYVAHPCANQVLKLDPNTLATTQTTTTSSRPGRVNAQRYLSASEATRAVFVGLPTEKKVTTFALDTLAPLTGSLATRTFSYTPTDVFVDAFGVLFVGSKDEGRIYQYNDQGGEVRWIGGQGSDAGRLNDPQAFDVFRQYSDYSGNVFIADSGNSRVQRMNPFGFSFWATPATGTSGGPGTGGVPTSSGNPSISGTATVGQQLTCSQGSWNGSPTSYSYSWTRNGTAISGATSAQYTLVGADAGTSIRCVVVASNASGPSSPATSAAVTPAAAPATQAPVNTGAPAIQGTAAVGQQLTCTQGSWSNSPTSYSYSWRRDGSEIATGSQYTLVAADGGRSITCVVTASNGGGSASASSGAVTPPVPVSAPVNTTRPAISGTARVGQTLTCSQGAWSNSPTGYAYAWNRDGSAISGATGTTYVVASADVARQLTCSVTASNSGGSATATSTAVTPQAATNTAVGVTINNGAEATNTTAVTLRIREPAGATAVQISNDGSFDNPTQRPISSTKNYAWTLDARGSERRARVVYVRFVGSGIDGNQTFSDDILLDTTAPSVTTATTSSRSTSTAAKAATTRVVAKDSGSGVQTIQYAKTKSALKARSLTAKKGRSFRVRPANAKFVRAIDAAGNKSAWKRVTYKAVKRTAKR